MDGEEWKEDAQRAEWNSPANIWLFEYSSYMDLNFNNILRPVVHQKQPVDKLTVGMIREEIDTKLAHPQFKSIPFPIQYAYNTFREYLVALENSTIDEVESSREALKGIFRLGVNCKVFGDGIKGGEKSIYFGRDPCRESKLETRIALVHAEKEGSSNLLESARKMAEICNNCPYRSI